MAGFGVNALDVVNQALANFTRSPTSPSASGSPSTPQQGGNAGIDTTLPSGLTFPSLPAIADNTLQSILSGMFSRSGRNAPSMFNAPLFGATGMARAVTGLRKGRGGVAIADAFSSAGDTSTVGGSGESVT